MKLLVYLFSLLISLSAFAQVESEEFEPSHWSKGVHLLGGFGLNSSLYKNDHEKRNFGVGSNLRADVGWFLNDHFAFEWSSSVKFNKVDSNLVWDTLLTLGIRYRFEDPFFHSQSLFVRGFGGWAPTVIYLNNSRPADVPASVSRLHANGPAFGLGLGTMTKTKSGLVLYLEWTAAIQWLDHRDEVVMDGTTPVVVGKSILADESRIYSTAFTFGGLFF